MNEFLPGSVDAIRQGIAAAQARASGTQLTSLESQDQQEQVEASSVSPFG